MTKFLFTATLLAIASLPTLNAAACAGSFTLSSFTSLADGCQVTTTAGTYTLTNWTLGNQFGSFTQPISASNILVTISTSGNSFTVDFSATQSGTPYFNLTSGQHVGFTTGFWIMPTSGGPYAGVNSTAGLTAIALQEMGTTGLASFSASKSMQNFSASNVFNPLHVIYTGTNAGCSNNNANCFGITTNPDSIAFNLYNGGFSIVDALSFSAGSGQSGSIASYRNIFTGPNSGIPEPMTFVLMGAGLVGIAALRRRKS